MLRRIVLHLPQAAESVAVYDSERGGTYDFTIRPYSNIYLYLEQASGGFTTKVRIAGFRDPDNRHHALAIRWACRGGVIRYCGARSQGCKVPSSNPRYYPNYQVSIKELRNKLVSNLATHGSDRRETRLEDAWRDSDTGAMQDQGTQRNALQYVDSRTTDIPAYAGEGHARDPPRSQ